MEKRAKQILDAWPSLLKTFLGLHFMMEEQIRAAKLPSLEIYDVLWTLEQAPEHRLRFHDLSERVYISRYNITRLANRLEDDGLLEKHQCPNDKRGMYAQLTKKGLKLRQDMWKIYRPLIEELFSNKLTQSEHKELIAILAKVTPQNKL